MMKNITLLLITASLLLLSYFTKAQNTFSEMYVDSQQNGIQAHAFVPSLDNGFMLTGELFGKKAMIIKIDSTGKVLWNKTFGDISNFYPHYDFYSITATADSGYVLAGKLLIASNVLQFAFCMKINAVGNPVWARYIHYPSYDNQLYSVQQTIDSGFIMSGSAQMSGNQSKLFIAKLDQYGNLQWSGLLTAGTSDVVGYRIKQTPDSAYAIFGSVGYSNSLLVKVSSSGSFLWAKRYSLQSQTYFANDFLITNDGFICYSGSSKNALMKTDFSGNVLWSKLYNRFYPGPGCSNCTPPRVLRTSDNGYVFVNGNCLSFGEMIKVDSTGNIVLAKELFNIPIDIQQTNGNGLIILGNGPLCGVSPGTLARQIGIIKTDSTGNSQQCVSTANEIASIDTLIITPITFTTSGAPGIADSIQPTLNKIDILAYPQCINVVPGIDKNKLREEITISPNPSNGKYSVSTNDIHVTQIIIYNTLGENIYQSEINGEHFEIDLRLQPPGIYYYKTFSTNELRTSGKLIIAK